MFRPAADSAFNTLELLTPKSTVCFTAGGTAIADASQTAFDAAVKRLQSCGGQIVNIDFSPFAETASLLYQSSFVAERYSGIRPFLDSATAAGKTVMEPSEALAQQRALNDDDRLLPVTRAIISGAGRLIDMTYGFLQDSNSLDRQVHQGKLAMVNKRLQTSGTLSHGKQVWPSPATCVGARLLPSLFPLSLLALPTKL